MKLWTVNGLMTIGVQQVNRVKMSSTNRLTLSTTKGRLLANQATRSGGDQGCTVYVPSKAAVEDAVSGGPRRRYLKAMEDAEEAVVVTAADHGDH